MAIEVIKDTTEDPPVELDLLIQTLEKNRDRLRTTAGMVMTLAGLSISASLAILFFYLKEGKAHPAAVALILFSALSMLASAVSSVEASLFRQDFAITSRSQFLADLLKLFYREYRIVKRATIAALLGLGSIAAAVIVQVVTNR